VLPNVLRVNRGKLSMEEVAEKALKFNAGKAAIVDRWKGGPGKIQLFRVGEKGLEGIPPIIYLKAVKLRRNFGEAMPRGRRIKSLAMVRFDKNFLEIERLENALSRFFGILPISFEEASSGDCDAVMQIVRDKLGRPIIMFRLIPELVEVGPRIVISHLVWDLT
jgi:rRNA maturation protein Rpf1